MTRAYFLAEVLRHIGHDPEIVGFLPDGETVYPEPPGGMNVVPVRGSFPFVMRSLPRYITGDILCSIKPLPTSFGAALMARRARRRPLIADVDDWELAFGQASVSPARASGPARGFARRGARSLRRLPKRISNQRSHFYVKWLERHLERADAVTTNTLALQERYGGTLVPSGKDTGRFDPSRCDADESRRRLGLEGRFVVMFPGTARAHKGLEDVLAALDELGNPNARLVIVGGRDMGAEFANTLAQKWPQWVVQLPQRGMADMPLTIAAAHVVVAAQRDVPAARAQFPMKLTDAMAMAKPIVSTTVGDIPRVLGENAWLVPPSDPLAIAAALRDIMRDPGEATRRGRGARDRCIQTLGLDAVGRVLDEVVSPLMRDARPA